MRRLICIILLFNALFATAGSIDGDSLLPIASDSLAPREESTKSSYGLIDRVYAVVKTFSQVDTNYVEPQHYNYTFMLQNINTFESYMVSCENKQRIWFTPDVSVKVGPFIGWRFLFLGYTFDVKHFNSDNKQELTLSLYSSQIGVDLFWRKTGDDYKIKQMYIDEDEELKSMRNVPFAGVDACVKGFNIYYITNHRRFSYPAAYSQSTVQRRSCGSPLFGIGYTKHSLSVDWQSLEALVEKQCGEELAERLDSSLLFGKIKYTDVSLSGGYAYNFVFAHNWLLNASLSLALGYKHSTGDRGYERFRLRDFSFKNINLDGVSRFGLVWNNTKWYVGGSAVFHAYNYHKSQFSTNTIFGNLNFYVGFNFIRR